MKKVKIIALLLFVFIAIPGFAFAAGSCTTVPIALEKESPTGIAVVTITCTGDAGAGALTGTVPNTSVPGWIIQYLTKKKPYQLVEVQAYPTSGGTAPDAASIFLLDANSLDLLGSEDGSTTPWAGLNLIHATLPRSAFPNKYLPRAGLHANYYPVVTGALTLKTIDQGTASADWTIRLIFFESDN